MNFKDLKAGDEVFLVEDDRRIRKPRYVKVVKKGRNTHVSLYGGTKTYVQKISSWCPDSWAIARGDSCYPPHYIIYESKEAYEQKLAWEESKGVISCFGANLDLSREVKMKIVDLLKREGVIE